MKLILLPIVSILVVLGLLECYALTDVAHTGLGVRWVPQAPSSLLILGFAICVIGAYLSRPRSNE